MAGALVRRRGVEMQTHKERLGDEGGRDWDDATTAQGLRATPGAGPDGKDPPLGPPERS